SRPARPATTEANVSPAKAEIPVNRKPWIGINTSLAAACTGPPGPATKPATTRRTNVSPTTGATRTARKSVTPLRSLNPAIRQSGPGVKPESTTEMKPDQAKL